MIWDAIHDPLQPRIIVVEAPPRHGKSEFLAKWFPAWYLGCFPDNRIIFTSYEANFARQWGRKVRNILDEHGRGYFGINIQEDNRSASEWAIEGHDGGMQTAGAGGPLVGKGGNCIVVDDPIKNAEEGRSAYQLDAMWDWWESTLTTRLEPDAIVILIATRWHERDPSGRLIKAHQDGTGEPVTRIHLPAIAEEGDILGRQPGEALWPQRFPKERLEQMRDGKSVYWWNALYQQRPTQHEGAEWPDEYFHGIMTEHWPSEFDVTVSALDPSKGRTDKSDYSAIVNASLRGGLIWLESNIKRRPVNEIVRDSFAFVPRNSVIFGVEANAFQELLLPIFFQYAKDLNTVPLPIEAMLNTLPKEMRIRRLSRWLANKHIRIRDNESGRLLLRQLKEFPLGDHDDGPDAADMAVQLLLKVCDASRRIRQNADNEADVVIIE